MHRAHDDALTVHACVSHLCPRSGPAPPLPSLARDTPMPRPRPPPHHHPHPHTLVSPCQSIPVQAPAQQPTQLFHRRVAQQRLHPGAAGRGSVQVQVQVDTLCSSRPRSRPHHSNNNGKDCSRRKHHTAQSWHLTCLSRRRAVPVDKPRHLQAEMLHLVRWLWPSW